MREDRSPLKGRYATDRNGQCVYCDRGGPFHDPFLAWCAAILFAGSAIRTAVWLIAKVV